MAGMYHAAMQNYSTRYRQRLDICLSDLLQCRADTERLLEVTAWWRPDGRCLAIAWPVPTDQGSSLQAGGRNHEDGRSADHRAISSPLLYFPNLGCGIMHTKYKSCGTSVDLAGRCRPVCRSA